MVKHVSDSKTYAEVIVVGAGDRGNVYSQYAITAPQKMKIVGVAEPSAERRKMFASQYGLSSENCFESYLDLAKRPKFADAIIVSTLDGLHAAVVKELAPLKYNILLEKPMAVTLQDCIDIHAAVLQNDIILAVCHVLRYTPHYTELKKIIDSGKLGEIYNVQHLEQIGETHFAHSFVRGNWAIEEQTSFSLMTKCIHDVDLISWFIGNAQCTKISSFGSLSHFKKSKKPSAAKDAKRCIDCSYERECPYSAKKIYLEPTVQGQTGWPISVLSNVVDIENITDAITNGPYGRCVYECKNDVLDNQVVNFEFQDGKTASMTMIAFTKDECIRKTRIYGSKGELVSDGDNEISYYEFNSKQTTTVHPNDLDEYKLYNEISGHVGGDYGIISCFIDSIINNDPSINKSDSLEALKSHVYVFAAEKSRLSNSVIDPNCLFQF
ncbi:putative oxidoreductase YteT [Smittium mucronatum]|uniref:Putative oxidoreductase YteT n=1 Tax=Smittium mucronatum TaxID=133383 RepID=A0A1R0GYB2_9FUNG|nr:putative oxidoreductase YteT [Smittium mucronatum]